MSFREDRCLLSPFSNREAPVVLVPKRSLIQAHSCYQRLDVRNQRAQLFDGLTVHPVVRLRTWCTHHHLHVLLFVGHANIPIAVDIDPRLSL
jgi:hypothetical protein